MSDTLTGKTIGKYDILERLGRGGMAVVYKGYQKNLDRFVAIKLMHAFLVTEQDFLNRFQREAKAMAALNHSNIVGIYDSDVYDENSYYLVMEYISGGTLKNKLEKLAQAQERLPIEDSVRIALEVANALTYAHRRNMVHRDIKPANIMIDEETGRAILTDFGIVKLIGGQSIAFTATGALIGTPAYMSPEQALGKSGDERADIYSLGVLLFQMVTGELPFEADTPLAVVMKHVNDPTPLPVSAYADIPEDLQAVILKAMAKSPEDRYQSAAEFSEALVTVDLSGVRADTAPTAVPPSPFDELEDLDTPILGKTVSSKTEVLESSPFDEFEDLDTPIYGKTVVSKADVHSYTIADETPVETAVKTKPKKTSPWLIGGIAAAVSLIIIGAIFVLSRRNNEATPTVPAVVVVSPVPTAPPTATTEPTNTAVPPPSPDDPATKTAFIALTETAKPTDTAVPTDTPTPIETPTPNATLDFLANCQQDIEIVVAYTYQSQNSSAAPVGATFPMHWILKNSGTCPWPAGSQWKYVDGTDLGNGEPITIENDVTADEEITLTTSMVAPTAPGTYNSVWQLTNEDGEPFGSPKTFSLVAYVPATIPPPATNTPVVVATPTPEEIVELNYAFEIQNCEYVGSDWRCRVHLTPYGGGGGPFTMFIFLNPIVELRNQFAYDYYVQARRCAAWNTEIKVIDEATGLEMSRHLYVEPDNYIAGGCVE